MTFEGERIFWNGLSAGVHVLETDRIGIDLMIAGRFDGFDIADLGRRELVANGLNPALLEDRDDALDAGIAIRWFGRAGQLKLRALAGVTDTSGGPGSDELRRRVVAKMRNARGGGASA